jgi:hypothetical protein
MACCWQTPSFQISSLVMAPDALRIDTLCPSTPCLAFHVQALPAAFSIVPVRTIKDNAGSGRLHCDAARPEHRFVVRQQYSVYACKSDFCHTCWNALKTIALDRQSPRHSAFPAPVSKICTLDSSLQLPLILPHNRFDVSDLP